ncbi:MAG: serine/threonine protein kinase, partial [Elusimicrobia bacterium]|nr:serine/threonine protein kinase [Elusimicrobiota bacterium]
MPDPDPLIGKTLGPCRLDELVGLGGMGRVYKARHLALDRVVAVKLVDAAGDLAGANRAALREQILAEARSAAKLEDPRIVAIHEVGEERGIPYIVMQWVDGESLEARVKRLGRLPPGEALEIIRETAAALGAAHKAGLVHRDIKPGNILVDARGAVKLADFGIARPAGAAAVPGETVSGSFHFMAPEQAFGAPPDPRSDLYALGATWYYALTGQPPFPGSPMDALVRHRDEASPEARVLRPEITERAADLLRRLMAKKVEDRPADAFVLLKEMMSAGMLLETDASGSPFKI